MDGVGIYSDKIGNKKYGKWKGGKKTKWIKEVEWLKEEKEQEQRFLSLKG